MKKFTWAIFYLLLILFLLYLTIPTYLQITDIHTFKGWFTLIIRTLCIVMFSNRLIYLFKVKPQNDSNYAPALQRIAGVHAAERIAEAAEIVIGLAEREVQPHLRCPAPARGPRARAPPWRQDAGRRPRISWRRRD